MLCYYLQKDIIGIGSKIKLGKFEDALKAYQKALEIDPQNSIAIDRIALINDNVTSKGTVTATPTTTTTTIANSSGLTGKIILALNLEHSDLLNGTGLQVFNYDRNKMLLNDTFTLRGDLNIQYLEFDPDRSLPGDYLGVCIDEVEAIDIPVTAFTFFQRHTNTK